uniref:Uncharacterized protein n=1 Tax=Arundo donax TaxID=35708 RepID=A0A0A9CK35_ARUDO
MHLNYKFRLTKEKETNMITKDWNAYTTTTNRSKFREVKLQCHTNKI